VTGGRSGYGSGLGSGLTGSGSGLTRLLQGPLWFAWSAGDELGDCAAKFARFRSSNNQKLFP